MLSTSPPPSLTSNLPPFKFPDSRLTFSRGRKREGPGMRLKLPPFCQEHHIQREFPQKKDRDSSPSFTILLRRGKGDSFSDIFCEVSSFLNVFSAELPTYKRELLNCAKIISEKSPVVCPLMFRFYYYIAQEKNKNLSNMAKIYTYQ